MKTNIVITGASRGIGAAIVSVFDPSTTELVAFSSKDGDLNDPAAPASLWQHALDRLDGRVDVLINNAGIFEASPIDTSDSDWLDSWNRTMQINLTASADLCRRAVLHWQSSETGGRIVNIASRAAHRGDSPAHWHYAASKAGMVAMTKTIARAYAAQHIYAFAICPGFTMTGMAEEYLDSRGGDKLLAEIPLGKVADPQEVAAIAKFCALDAPPSMTGVVLDVNGASYVDNWCLALPCTRAEAEMLHDADEIFAAMSPSPSVATREVEAFNDAKWEMLAYFNGKPSAAVVRQVHSLLPSAADAKPLLEKLPDENWLTISQQGLKPVRAGRFFVHTGSNAQTIPTDAKSFRIEASQAFGTGGHETTAGCLAILDAMKREGKRFELIADIGTGTGLLAFAASHLWPRAYITASDIDPVSIDVTVGNADANNVALGQSPGQIALCVAAGTDHEMIQRRAPYDLVIANILAGPLIELAPSLAKIMHDGGTLILAGLLNTQAASVIRSYRMLGFRLEQRRNNGDWPCLRLVKRRKHAWQRPIRADGRTSQPPGDFGTW